MSPLSQRLFLAFAWLTLVYVLTVFFDLTATTFAPSLPPDLPEDAAAAALRIGGGVATSSILFILLAIAFGFCIYKLRLSQIAGSVFFVPLVFVAIWAGQMAPVRLEQGIWLWVLVAYAFAASVTPVWVLLQPRDYLSSFLLYACIAGAIAGAVAGVFAGDSSLDLVYPAFLGFHSDKLGYLFPALFITIACGACSGFHSLVASGTTAKQLDRERDARLIGYGGMLIEGVLALIALLCVAILVQADPVTAMAPPKIFSVSMGRFLSFLGLPGAFGQAFGLLAISTFLLTTLDTGTRLGRYIFEEFFSLKGKWTRLIPTGATLVFPCLFLSMTLHDASGNVVPAWRIIWPIFGATNQLLAGLALLIISVWLKSRGRNFLVTLIPMAFMIVMTMTALVILVQNYGLANPVGFVAVILFLLAFILLIEASRSILARHK